MKFYLSSQKLYEYSFQLAANIIKSDFKPNFLVAIWRGGTPVGITVQEVLRYYGFDTDHIAIRTSYYTGLSDTKKEVKVYNLDYLRNILNHDDKLLIIDDVFDTGNSIQAVIKNLQKKTRLNMPTDTRIATVFYKPKKNKTNIVPDFYIKKIDNWIIFPHEMEGLAKKDIMANKSGIAHIMEDIEANLKSKNK